MKATRDRKKGLTESTLADKPKDAQQILEEQIQAGLHEFNRSSGGLFMSAIAAGMEVGFSVLFMSTIFTMFGHQLSSEVLHLYLALCYPLGFIFVIIGRSELFTEHTALAILPVLRGTVSVVDLLRLWGIIYLGNLIGGYFFSFILLALGSEISFIDASSFYHLAHELIEYSSRAIFISALLAGWMMGLLGWLLTSSQETISRIFVIILVTSIIGIAGLHHCIVGSIEVFAGMISSDKVSWIDYIRFQFWATIGNAIGGSVFVAILKYSHVRFK